MKKILNLLFVSLFTLILTFSLVACDGDRGDQGIDGITGPSGIDGITGPSGIPGVQGEKGADGTGANAAVQIHEGAGHLDILSDGKLGFCPEGYHASPSSNDICVDSAGDPVPAP